MAQKTKKRTRKSKARLREEKQSELRQWITIVILVAFTAIGLLKAGTVGVFLYNTLRFFLGDQFYIVIAIAILWFLISIAGLKKDADDERNPVPMILLIADFLLFAGYRIAGSSVGFDAMAFMFTDMGRFFAADAAVRAGGGLVGNGLYALVSLLFGRQGTVIAMAAVLMIATVLMGMMDVYKNAFSYVIEFFRAPERPEKKEPEEEAPKEKPNLWRMIHEHSEKKANFIQADRPVEDQSLNEVQKKLDQGEEVIVRFRPKPVHGGTSRIDIRADADDGDTRELSLLAEGTDLDRTLKMQRPLSTQENIFISISDLEDNVVQPAPQETVIRSPYETQDSDEDTEEIVLPHMDEQMPLPAAPQEQEELPEDASEEEAPHEEPHQEAAEEEGDDSSEKKKPTVDYSHYRLPRLERVLDPVPPKNSNSENVRNAKVRGQQLISLLEQFDIHAHLADIHIGPSVTQFEVQTEATVKVSKILGLTDNLKMSLEARDIRIEAPIPGKNAVGIEIPNEKSTPVKMKELVGTIPEKDKDQPLLFMLGKDLLGRTVTCRIDKMPHLLIAGATGSGKSVCMNSIICSLLLRTKPDQVKMLLVDPKKVEFTPYKSIPHLIGPVINDAAEANNALKVIVRIMDERYNIFAANGVRNIAGYHAFLKKKTPEEQKRMDPMPYIVVIIDELADLMLVAGKEVEASIQRITQLARAAGIHLIVATQRPSTDVITGIIKANIPSRIAFSVSSGIDSRTILDHVGAERLLGNGDMLYLPIGQNSPTRIQGVFVTDEEVERIAGACSAQGAPLYDDSFIMLEGVNDGEGAGGLEVSDDPLYAEVKDYVIDAQKASTSLLQRRFGIGYNRAARMIDELERTGVIGPAQGSKPRDVYIKKDKSGSEH